MDNVSINPLVASMRELGKPVDSGAMKSASNNLFQQLIQETNKDQQTSDIAIQDFMMQKPGTSVQQVVMAVAQAEMSFQFFMEVRNKLIDSYNELMRMQF